MKKKTKISVRALKYASLSATVALVFCLLLALLNFVAGAAAKRLPLTWDLTANKVFLLSQASVSFLETLQDPVAITVLADAAELENGAGYYAQAKSILDQYAKRSPLVTVRYVDPVKNPGFVAQYPALNPEQYDILITCKQKSEKVNLFSLFNIAYNQYTQQQYIQSSRAEQEISAAILRVVANSETKVLLLTGQQQTYPEALHEFLRKNGYRPTEQSLLTDTLDETAEIAFLLAPQADLEPAMLDKLTAFLKNGGEYNRQLVYAPHPTAPETPNLNAFLAQWGIAVGPQIIMEQNTARYANNQPYLCLVEYAAEDYTENIPETSLFLSPLGRSLTRSFAQQGFYTAEILLSYSAQSYAVSADTPQNWQPSKADLAARPALIRSALTAQSGAAAAESHVFAFASCAAFDASALQSGSVANAQYLAALLGAARGQETFLSIPPKSFQAESLGLNQAQATLFSLLFTGLLPIAVAIAGIAVWLLRRNR